MDVLSICKEEKMYECMTWKKNFDALFVTNASVCVARIAINVK